LLIVKKGLIGDTLVNLPLDNDAPPSQHVHAHPSWIIDQIVPGVQSLYLFPFSGLDNAAFIVTLGYHFG
jgi:hypothetical protein